MPKLHRESNFSAMLIGLLITLVIGPVLLELDLYSGGIGIQTVLAITLIVSIWSAIDSRLWFYGGIALALVNGAATVLDYVSPSFAGDVIGLCSTLLFCALSIAFVVSRLLAMGSGFAITQNHVIGAVSIYLLLGIGFGVLNMLLEVLMPGSFRGLDPTGSGSSSIDLIYFSFVSLTTLGYGDIVPIRPLARAVAYMGAVTGQFYLAILVAGLVGAFVSQGITARKSE